MRRRSSSSGETGHTPELREHKPLLCSDLVQIIWTEANGTRWREIAILENLSLSGVGLLMGVPISEGVHVQMLIDEMQLAGSVRQCRFRENGYIIVLELDASSQWAQMPGRELVPEHLLDVSLLDLD